MKRFENLPSTNTPIIEGSLNQFEDKLIVVSATEPTGDDREKVWVKKSKNLFDKNTNIINNKGLSDSNGTLFDSSVSSVHGYIKVEPNTTYTYSGYNDTTYTKRVSVYSSSLESSFIRNEQTTENALTFTTPNNAHYIRIQFKTSELNNVQLEKGYATEYESYVTPGIYALSNSKYEEVISTDNLEQYSTNETKIGTWIDGKPLYRKVFVGTYADASIMQLNVDTLVNANGSAYISNSWRTFPFYIISNSKSYRATLSLNTTNGAEIQLKEADAGVSRQVKLVLEYTKTTDSSGIRTMSLDEE